MKISYKLLSLYFLILNGCSPSEVEPKLPDPLIIFSDLSLEYTGKYRGGDPISVNGITLRGLKVSTVRDDRVGEHRLQVAGIEMWSLEKSLDIKQMGFVSLESFLNTVDAKIVTPKLDGAVAACSMFGLGSNIKFTKGSENMILIQSGLTGNDSIYVVSLMSGNVLWMNTSSDIDGKEVIIAQELLEYSEPE